MQGEGGIKQRTFTMYYHNMKKQWYLYWKKIKKNQGRALKEVVSHFGKYVPSLSWQEEYEKWSYSW